MNNIRNTTGVVTSDGGRFLLARYNDSIYGKIYVCVGGEQETDESMEQNIKRECLEEIGCEVEVGGLLFAREITFTDSASNEQVHRIEHYFSCKIKDGQAVHTGSVPDLTSDGFAYLTLDEIKNATVFSKNLAELIEENFKTRYVCDML